MTKNLGYLAPPKWLEIYWKNKNIAQISDTNLCWKKQFHANKKTPFYDSIFYDFKVVKKNLGIYCELMDPLTSRVGHTIPIDKVTAKSLIALMHTFHFY